MRHRWGPNRLVEFYAIFIISGPILICNFIFPLFCCLAWVRSFVVLLSVLNCGTKRSTDIPIQLWILPVPRFTTSKWALHARCWVTFPRVFSYDKCAIWSNTWTKWKTIENIPYNFGSLCERFLSWHLLE